MVQIWGFSKFISCGIYRSLKCICWRRALQKIFSVSKKILCIAFSFVKVCCKLLIISRYLILVLYFYFQTVYLPIECVIVNLGFMSVVFLLTWSTSKQDLQIDRCFSCDVSSTQSLSKAGSKQQQHKSDFTIVWIPFLRSNDKDDWHFPDCHQCNHEQVSTCQLQGVLCKSWTLHVYMNFANVNMFWKITMQKQNVLCRSSHSETQINLDSLSICCIIALNLTLCIKCNKICIWICQNVHPPHLAKMSFALPMTSLRLLVSVLEIRNWT